MRANGSKMSCTTAIGSHGFGDRDHVTVGASQASYCLLGAELLKITTIGSAHTLKRVATPPVFFNSAC